MRQKNLHSILAIVLISLILSSCSGWLSSPARSIYKEADVAWDNGEYAEALYLNSKAVLADPEQKRPIKFMDEKFENGMNKIQQFLESSKKPASAALAEKRYATLKTLVAFYDNVKEMKMPLKFKDKFRWETDFVDYTAKLEQSRKMAITALYKRGDKMFTTYNIKSAEAAFKKAREKYAKATEKDSLVNLAYDKQMAHGNKYKDSKNIKQAASAYFAFGAALDYKDVPKVKKLQKKTKLHVSDLWVAKGKELEAKGNLANMEGAAKSYKSALKWNKANEKAKELQEAVKPKIAEIYYQKGRKAEKAANRNVAQIKSYYENARKYVPDYKDAMNRYFTFDILNELESVQKNITTTEGEHGKFQGDFKKLNESVKYANDRVATVKKFSNQLRDMKSTIKDVRVILSVLSPLPAVGSACSMASTTLNVIGKKVNIFVRFFNRFEKPVITPTVETLQKTSETVGSITEQVNKTQDMLGYTKESFATAESCLLNLEKEDDYKEFGTGAKGINSSLDPLNKTLHNINAQRSGVNNAAIAVGNAATGVANVANQLQPMFNVVDKISHYTDKVHSTLDHDIKIGYKMISVSVNPLDVLKTGGKYLGKVTDWVMDKLGSALEAMKVPVPEVPGASEVEKALEDVKSQYEKLQKEVDKLENEYKKYSNYQKRIRNYSNDMRAKCFGKAYYIQSAKEYGKSKKGYWDIPGYDPGYKKDQTIQVWELGKNKPGDRKFYIEQLDKNYVRITAHHGVGMGYLDVSGGNTKNGTDIQLWDKNGSSAQKFKLKEVGDGVYKIYTAKGQVICLAGRSTKNGSNVHIWKDHNVDAVKWVFIDTKTNKKAVLEN